MCCATLVIRVYLNNYTLSYRILRSQHLALKKRRQPQSSALSFIDCICCGFGAVLLLFILTAKSQIVQKEVEEKQSVDALEFLQKEISQKEQEQQAIEQELSKLDLPQNAETTQIDTLAAEHAQLKEAIEKEKAALALLDKETEPTEQVAALERPSAVQNYLSGLKLNGLRVVILLENSGSMLAEDARGAVEVIQSGSQNQSQKWLRAKAAVRTVLAAIPKGTQVAVLQMNQTATPLTGTAEDPYIDPYDNTALISLLEKLDALKASGGANLSYALTAIRNLSEKPSSLLIIGDGLPTAPNPTNRSLSEADRVQLFNQAMASRPDLPVNVILFPFEGDPAAAGLFWKMSSRTDGILIVPDEDWPPL